MAHTNPLPAVRSNPTASGGTPFLGHLLARLSAAQPDATALIISSTREHVRYRDLSSTVDQLAAKLQVNGLGAGDRVLLQARNTPEFVVALLAAARVGAVVAPVSSDLHSADLEDRYQDAGARVVLTDGRGEDLGSLTEAATIPVWTVTTSTRAGAAPGLDVSLGCAGRLSPASSAPTGSSAEDELIMFTAGTTGRPKMVPWTGENIAAGLHGITSSYRLGPLDSTVAVMPLFHGHGLMAGLLATLSTGGTVLLPAAGKFTAHTFWSDVQAAHATWFTAAPTIHQILLARAGDEFPGEAEVKLRFVRSCSAPLNLATAHRLRDTFFAPVARAYGMTEATHQVSTTRPGQGRGGNVGWPDTVRIDIRKTDGARCAAGETGEIMLSGPSIARGYLGAPTVNDFEDGWLHTGDLGKLSAHGTLTVTGRIKELINRGGEKVSPERVEDVLAGFPGVSEAAVFPVPDDTYGEIVRAAIVATAGTRLHIDDLARFCEEHLSAFEVPDRIDVVKSLPHTAKGALDRSALKELVPAS